MASRAPVRFGRPAAWGWLAAAVGVLGGAAVLRLQDGPAGAAEAAAAVSFRRVSHAFVVERLAHTRPPDELNASHLSPLATRRELRFEYELRILDALGALDLPLALAYRDGGRAGALGPGWQLVVPAAFAAAEAVDVLSPALPVHRDTLGWTVGLGRTPVPVRPVPGEPGLVLEAEPDSAGRTWRFTAWPAGDAAPRRVVPLALRAAGGAEARFRYQGEPSAPRLHSIAAGDAGLRLAYDGPRLRAIRGDGGAGETAWELDYDTAAGEAFVRGIRRSGRGAPPAVFRFSYAPFEPAPAAPGARPAEMVGIWRRVVGEPRFVLPARMRVSNEPGLRLVDLNRDGAVDVVRVQDGRRQAWLWGGPAGWLEITRSYSPCTALMGTRRSLGAVFNPLPQRFFDNRKNTDSHDAIVVSTYQPSGDTLAYDSAVCFPRVWNDSLRPENGQAWRIVRDRRLRLPVPLQYTGEAAWPLDHPERFPAVESSRNQGAQFVQFNPPNVNLYYVGLLYRDSATGRVLLPEARHRAAAAGNCRFRYYTRWGRHAVEVQLCQALWESRDEFWPGEPDPADTASFWERKDLGPAGRPNGRYTLPWPDDPAYLFHYESLRSVQFARLDDEYATFALVRGRARQSSEPDEAHPEARELLGLVPGTWNWERMGPGSPFLPPAEFLDSFNGREFNGQFVDLNGDGLDDAVLAVRHAPRRTWLNNRFGGPRWVERPNYRLPASCDLDSGRCRLFDLNSDGYQDLFLENGETVYINETRPRGRHMTHFTDADARYRPVAEVPPGGGGSRP
jgi:hypothetical protein